MNRIFFAIIITIACVLDGKTAYAQVESKSIQKQEANEATNSIEETAKAENADFFTIDNNIYKILDQEKNDGRVILWSYKGSGNTDEIIVDNEVNYNGNTFKVKYIHVKAFNESNSNTKSITIGDKVLGFCDSSGNLIEILDEIFKNKVKLKSIDLGNIECVFGQNCFQNCTKILNVEIPKNMHKIERHCFDKCYSLKNIDLSEIKEFNGQSSFELCRELNDIGEFNDELIELPARTFINCSKLEIDNLKNIKRLGNECFKACRLLNQNILTNIEEIGENCFRDCNFTEIYLKKAKNIENYAFAGIESLRKIRFGNPKIPSLKESIVEGSSVNEWIYPLDYKTQPMYLSFLSKLKVAKVIWNYNYGNFEFKITQEDKLNSLKPPNITREGYEIEGWYKESKCINKVNMLADLGEILDSDLVIKDPELYAKWILKEDENNHNESQDPTEEEPNKPSDPKESGSEEENNKPNEPDESTQDEDSSKPRDPQEKEADRGNDKPTKPQEPTAKDEMAEPREQNNLTPEQDQNNSNEHKESLNEEVDEQNNLNETNKEISKDRNSNFSKKLSNIRNVKNYINDFTIKINNESKDVDLKESHPSSLDHKIAKNFIMPLVRENNVGLEVSNWSYKDRMNNNVETTKSGLLGRVMKKDECIGIYLKSNDHFEKNSIVNMKFKSTIKPNKIYSYSEELGKFMLIKDKFSVADDIVEINTTNKKHYLITQFDLNEDDIAVEGWNKILPKQSNALLSKYIDEISWAYLQGEDLAKGWIKDIKRNNWYFINDKGIMETGWLKDKDNRWYYLNRISDGTKGVMKTGWNRIDNEWYYLQADGILAVNTVIDGYSVGSNGKLI